MRTRSTTFACPFDLRQALDAAALARGVSIAHVIVEALRANLAGGPQADGKQAPLWATSQALDEALDRIKHLEQRLEALPLVTPRTSTRPRGRELLKIGGRAITGDDRPAQSGDVYSADPDGWLTTREAFVLSGLSEKEWRNMQARFSKGEVPGWEQHPDPERRKHRKAWLRKAEERG